MRRCQARLTRCLPTAFIVMGDRSQEHQTWGTGTRIHQGIGLRPKIHQKIRSGVLSCPSRQRARKLERMAARYECVRDFRRRRFFSEAPKDKIDFTGFEFGDYADFSRCKWRGG